MSASQSRTDAADPGAILEAAIAHLEHLLPGQAPIRDFVHHNTLHGYQHLPFTEALALAARRTGSPGYLPETQFRALYRAGRIRREDLEQAITADRGLEAETTLFVSAHGPVLRRAVYLAALAHPIRPLTGCQLTWHMEELDAARRFHPEVAAESRRRLLAAAGAGGADQEAAALRALWEECMEVLGLQQLLLHPEALVDLSPAQAERMLAELSPLEGETARPRVDRLIKLEADHLLFQLLDRTGTDLTLRGLLLALTGQDLLEDIQPLLARQLTSFLDQGFAAWHLPRRDQGFFAAWRAAARADLAWLFEDLPDWHDGIETLPANSVDAIAMELRLRGLPPARWAAYLERLAMELPGWSGMFHWRHRHPGYAGTEPVPVAMGDYLAVRLALERLYARRLTRRRWQIEASLDLLRWYFRHHSAEFLVCYSLYNTRLPEYLVTRAQRLLARDAQDPGGVEEWQQVARMIWTWRRSPAADLGRGYTAHRSAWRLYLLAQHLGLCAAEVRQLGPEQVRSLFECLDRLEPERVGALWLAAYEAHYRDELFNALLDNRGRHGARIEAPGAQLAFCMDDREEGIRRHLEELDPAVETFGTAGFFGVAMAWRGLDDSSLTPLCPVTIVPVHEVREVPAPGHRASHRRHRIRLHRRLWARDLLFQGTRRHLFTATAVLAAAAPLATLALAAKSWFPRRLGELSRRWAAAFDRTPPTRVQFTAPDTRATASPETLRLGFGDREQAARVAGLLRAIGLTRGFAPIVVLVGHGSMSRNNPHLAAYDCGACSGRHGGPNARVFAAMANRPEVRRLLLESGLSVPESTWFLGVEHNTGDESFLCYDLDTVPEALHGALARVQDLLARAGRASAHERCRRLASAPAAPSPEQARRHMAARSLDFSQVRPELGHAGNAAAIIGRRSLSRGLFLDRRVFLISYDPSKDPEGGALEALLLAALPVGAGISLEYYFSTASNDHYGCGSKVTHNIAGLFGVMEGNSGDLRTGLPRQMIEIHEAMRQQVVVEAATPILERIYRRQPAIRELVGNRWVHLSALDPNTGEISMFDPDRGFVPWRGPRHALPVVARSADWYGGHRDALPPARIAG